MADRIRTTISLDPEVHAIFVRMAEAGGMSVSRCMGDWLADTADGAQFVAQKMQEARKAPRTVMREFQAMAKGLGDEAASVLDTLRRPSGPGSSPAAARPRRAAAEQPPCSPTGVKSPRKGTGKGRKAA